MLIYRKSVKGHPVAEVDIATKMTGDAAEMLDLMAEAGMNGCDELIVHSESLHPDFFDLKNGIAGEILQKFSNYRMRLSIVGDFSQVSSKSLRDFIRESNRGKTILFTDSVQEALKR
jgi:hypothetical protein